MKDDEQKVQQIKSRERVRARGEVFTAPREVNAMLDLVKEETENIDSTFLEPACGDGNFLDEVLRRKLAVCAKKYGKSPADYEKFSFLACTTLYGVDIMADNVTRCRERLFETWKISFKTDRVRPSDDDGSRGARSLPCAMRDYRCGLGMPVELKIDCSVPCFKGALP